MKFLVLLLLALIIACTGVASPQNSAESAEFKTVAMVRVDDEYNVRAFCAGVWLTNEVFITARHCVKDETSFQYVAFGDFDVTHLVVRDAVVFAVDIKNDLALLRTDNPPPTHGVARLAMSARVGEELDIVGHPLGKMWTYMHGYISQSRFGENGTDALQVSAPIFFGNSGGGAFNSRGELVGICSWMTRAPNTGFFIRFNAVRNFIYDNEVR